MMMMMVMMMVVESGCVILLVMMRVVSVLGSVTREWRVILVHRSGDRGGEDIVNRVRARPVGRRR